MSSDPILDAAQQLSQTRDTGAHDMAQDAIQGTPVSATDLSAAQNYPSAPVYGGLTTEQKQLAYGQKPDGTFYKKNELWPSDQPPGTNWLDVLLGVAKAAPGGIKTYYDIQAQNAAFKATRPAKQPKVPLPSLNQPRSSWTPIVIAGLALLVVGGGAFAISRRRSAAPAPAKKSTGRTSK